MSLEFSSFLFFRIFDGLILGCMYALMGLGLNLIFGIMDIVNFSHGEFYILGGYLFFVLTEWLGISPILTLPTSVLAIFIIGLIVQRILIRPATVYGIDYSVIITFAMSIFIQNLALVLFGPWFFKPLELIGGSSNLFGTISYSNARALGGFLSLCSIIGIILLMKKTMFGKAVRAVVQDKEGAAFVGINVDRISMFGFGLGVALAALAGVFLTPIFMLTPTAGIMPVTKAFAIVILGGMGSIKGSIFAGALLGCTETFGSAYISTAYRDAFGFLIIVIVLLIRPRGLFGVK